MFSTKVECGGYCAATLNCGAFHFNNESCRLLQSADVFVYEEDLDTQDVYMLINDAGIAGYDFYYCWR